MTLFSNISPPLIQDALSQPMSILDLFIPGFSNITSAASQALNGKLTGYTQLVCLFALAAFLKPYVFLLKFWFMEHFTSTVRINLSDETYDMVQVWISSCGLDDTSRSILAKVMTKQKAQGGYEGRTKKALQYAPWEGAFYFWYKMHLLLYTTREVDVGFRKEEQLTITCFGRSTYILKSFLDDCRRVYLNDLKDKTTIYGHRGHYWRKEKSVTARPLSTVILNEGQKEPLIKDLKNFLNPETQQWYSKHSILYKRGYLLYGPPGTGKTSFSLSVAGTLDMDIYLISIPSVDDEKLKDLFAALPDRCVVLLEDIDAIGAAYSRDLNPKVSDSDRDTEPTKRAVTLSGLLNALDGVSSQENRVLIMTTNHPENLDEALTRPGRVDLKVEFQLCDRVVAKEIYCFIFGQPKAECVDDAQQEKHTREFEEQSEIFAGKIPESVFSPAEIMAHLLQHRHSPADAIEHCDQWVDDLLKKKSRKGSAEKDHVDNLD